MTDDKDIRIINKLAGIKNKINHTVRKNSKNLNIQ